jgi:hypothetical protein
MAKASRTDHSKLKQEGESGIHAIRMHERLKYKEQDVKKKYILCTRDRT